MSVKTINSMVNNAGMKWLLVAQIVVMLPFLLHLPFWLGVVLLFATGWRVRASHGAWVQPQLMLKAAMILAGLVALVMSGLEPMSLDMLASLLLLAFALKAVETINRRDAAVVVFTGYFLVAIQFLYSQSIGAALYGVLCLILLTTALVAAQQTTQKKIRDPLKLAGSMLVQCLPLMIVVYLFFPRLPPLWAVSLPNSQARTGMSDRMAPGDIAKLSQSDAPAFRVSFEGRRPAQRQLYWRGMTLNHFDGVTWQQFAKPLSPKALEQVLRVEPDRWKLKARAQDKTRAYEIIYEPSWQHWLFTLPSVVSWEGKATLGADYRLTAERIIQAPFALKVESDLEMARDHLPPPLLRELSLQLPEGQNPRSLALAQQWRQQTGNDIAYVQRVMAHFRKQMFYYTLRPPLAGKKDTVDNFLFDSRRGFCSHYAGSFVYLMRAAGIPARVVVGYQGGEWNEASKYLTVYQYDAHAWTEVWIEGEGWVRFDPTAMVAPDRIEQNLQTAVKEEGSFLEGNPFSITRIAWMSSLRQQWDAVQYGWRRWVLGYDNERQTQFLKDRLGDMSVMRIALVFGSLLALVMLFWLILLGFFRTGNELSPAVKVYRKFCRKLAKRGFERSPEVAPNQYGVLAAAYFPERAGMILEASKLYERITYGCLSPGQKSELLKRFKHAVRCV